MKCLSRESRISVLPGVLFRPWAAAWPCCRRRESCLPASRPRVAWNGVEKRILLLIEWIRFLTMLSFVWGQDRVHSGKIRNMNCRRKSTSRRNCFQPLTKHLERSAETWNSTCIWDVGKWKVRFKLPTQQRAQVFGVHFTVAQYTSHLSYPGSYPLIRDHFNETDDVIASNT